MKRKMQFKLIPLLLWGAVCAIFISCEQSRVETQGKNIARVDNEYLTVEQAKGAIPSYMYKQDSLSVLKQYRRQWIERRLILREARKLGLEQQKEVQDKIQRAREEVLWEALREYFILAKVDSTVTDQEARAYYESNKDRFELGEQYVQYRHLRTDNINDARTARQALQEGAPWKEVADSYAMEPTAAIGNAQKFYPVSSALENVDIMHRYLQTMDINEISPIQRARGVYHFVQLTDKREQSDSADLEWVIEKVKNWIILDKRRRKFNSYLKNLYLKAESDNEIEVYNVLKKKFNSKNTSADTIESNTSNE